MDDYVFDEVLDKLSAYLRFNGVVRFYHQHFAKWLATQNIAGFSINKYRGNRHIADYLFDHCDQLESEPGDATATPHNYSKVGRN